MYLTTGANMFNKINSSTKFLSNAWFYIYLVWQYKLQLQRLCKVAINI